MSNVANALNKSAPSERRKKIQHFVDFFQGFRYSPVFSGNRDFVSPLGVLLENKVDCDSVSVAAAATLESVGIAVVFVIFDNVLTEMATPRVTCLLLSSACPILGINIVYLVAGSSYSLS